jgi:hyperosmotically inducible periplasmic protein
MKKQLAILSLGLAIAVGCGDKPRTATDTALNARDRSGDTLTAQDQSNADADVTLTQRIRQAIVQEDSLSTNAHNVKIITVDGVVTLRGPVNNASEKARVAQKAQTIAGANRVNDQLEIVSQ